MLTICLFELHEHRDTSQLDLDYFFIIYNSSVSPHKPSAGGSEGIHSVRLMTFENLLV